MLNFPSWKVWGITLLCVLGVLMAVPSLLPADASRQLPAWARNVHINLGLDLAGGSHLLLEADTGDVARQRLEAMEDTVRRDMRSNGIGIGQVSTSGGQLSFVVRNPAQAGAAAARVRELAQPGGFGSVREWEVQAEGNRMLLRPTQAGLDAAGDQAMDVTRDVIDRR